MCGRSRAFGVGELKCEAKSVEGPAFFRSFSFSIFAIFLTIFSPFLLLFFFAVSLCFSVDVVSYYVRPAKNFP
jgi:hypothetical protein